MRNIVLGSAKGTKRNGSTEEHRPSRSVSTSSRYFRAVKISLGHGRKTGTSVGEAARRGMIDFAPPPPPDSLRRANETNTLTTCQRREAVPRDRPVDVYSREFSCGRRNAFCGRHRLVSGEDLRNNVRRSIYPQTPHPKMISRSRRRRSRLT